MKCAYHINSEAVDICSVCKRHICAECTGSLMGKVICERCRTAIFSRFKRKVGSQQSEDRKLSYILPAASIFMAVTFLLLHISVGGSPYFLIIGLILLAMGVFFFVVIYLGWKKERRIEEEKPTRNKKIGWVLITIVALFWAAMPASNFVFDMSLMLIVVSIVISFILLIIGIKLAKW